jgi:hypothetical protein
VGLLRRTPVRSALLLATIAAALVGGVGAGVAGAGDGDVPATISVTKTKVNAKWQEGWLLPGRSVVVTGRSDGAATIRAVLQRLGPPKTNPVRVNLPIKRAGTFTLTLPLYARSLPGRYSLRIIGWGESASIEPVETTVTLPSPVEGVADRSEVGTTPSGPWHVYDLRKKTSPVLRGQYKKLYSRFTFLSPPTGKDIRVLWTSNFGQHLLGTVTKHYHRQIDTNVSSGAPLAPGTWLIKLVVNGRVAKQGSIRIAS